MASGDSLSTHGHSGLGDGSLIPLTVPVENENNMFRQAEKWVNEVRNAHAVINIALIRNGVSRPLLATPDKTVFKYTDRQGVFVVEVVRDYIINIEDYRVLATALIPEKGDIIEEIDGATKRTYKVLPTNNEPVYIETGAYHTAYRVHTKKIKTEAI